MVPPTREFCFGCPGRVQAQGLVARAQMSGKEVAPRPRRGQWTRKTGKGELALGTAAARSFRPCLQSWQCRVSDGPAPGLDLSSQAGEGGDSALLFPEVVPAFL
jgi:hypothetical protein